MASRTSSSFMVYIHQCEIDEIRKQFEQHRRKESGGDLFGLWTNSGHAVIHLVSGITKTSNLNSSGDSSRERVNDLKILLEEKYMLCHIGKWRFNPSVTSSEPSASDEAAVKHFCSRGDGQKACILLKFNEGKADIQTYLFMGRNQHISANLRILSGSQSSNQVTENPLRNVPAIREKLQSGTPLSTGQSRGSNNGETFENESGELGKSPSAQTPTLLSLSHQSASSQTTSIPPSQPCFVSSTTQSSALLQGIQTVNSSAQSPSSSTTPKPPPKLNVAGEKILKQVQEKVKDLKTVVLYCEPSSTGDVDLKLEANQIKCTVHFPVTFPEEPAKVFYRLPEQPCIFEAKHPNKKFDSLDSILSVVKWRFEYHIGFSSLSSANAVTTTAPQVNDADSLRSEAPPDINVVEDEVLKFAEELQDKIKKTFKIPGDVELEVKTKKSEKKVELRFEHQYRNNKKWLIVLPTKFREQPTQIYHVNLVDHETRVGGEVCERSDQIIAAIKESCICGSCFSSR